MKFTERIKLYCKDPKCVGYDIKDFKDELTINFYKKLKKMVYDWENKIFYSKNIYETYGKSPYCEYMFLDKTVTNARLNPVFTVVHELDIYFQNLGRLEIHNINVDTQNEHLITVTICTGRPGFIIGKGGSTIKHFENKLSEMFNKPTKIVIKEVKNDINSPVYVGY